MTGLLLWLCLASNMPVVVAPARMPPAMAGIPNIVIDEFDVRGQTPKEIADSLWDQSFHVEGLANAAAVTHSDMRVAWTSVRTATRCRPVDPVVQPRFRVLLPRHVGSVLSPVMQGRWNEFRSAIETHEAEHVHITLAYATRIRAALAAADSCDAANAAVDRLGAELHRANATLDAQNCVAFRNGDGSPAALVECPQVLLYDWR